MNLIYAVLVVLGAVLLIVFAPFIYIGLKIKKLANYIHFRKHHNGKKYARGETYFDTFMNCATSFFGEKPLTKNLLKVYVNGITIKYDFGIIKVSCGEYTHEYYDEYVSQEDIWKYTEDYYIDYYARESQDSFRINDLADDERKDICLRRTTAYKYEDLLYKLYSHLFVKVEHRFILSCSDNGISGESIVEAIQKEYGINREDGIREFQNMLAYRILKDSTYDLHSFSFGESKDEHQMGTYHEITDEDLHKKYTLGDVLTNRWFVVTNADMCITRWVYLHKELFPKFFNISVR